MNKVIKIFICVALFISVGFMSVGYAAISGTLQVKGGADAAPQEGVFISDVTYAADGSVKSESYTSSVLVSTVDLGTGGTSTVTLTVELFNNSMITYGFSAVKYMTGEGTYDNENIVFTLGNLELRQEIVPMSYHTFTVTFSYKDGTNITDTELTSVLRFEFLPIDDITGDDSDVAASGVLEKFKYILNTPEQSQRLTDQMDKNTENDRHDDSYIGNVVGASEPDIELLNELFLGDLTLNINGTDTQVRIMIKRENIDGNTSTGDENGNEMTIYMTTSELDTRFQRVPVYVGVFTKYNDEDGWVQLGQMFEGTATTKRYDGYVFGTGSFDTDSWRSTNANGQVSGRTIEQMI